MSISSAARMDNEFVSDLVSIGGNLEEEDTQIVNIVSQGLMEIGVGSNERQFTPLDSTRVSSVDSGILSSPETPEAPETPEMSFNALLNEFIEITERLCKIDEYPATVRGSEKISSERAILVERKNRLFKESSELDEYDNPPTGKLVDAALDCYQGLYTAEPRSACAQVEADVRTSMRKEISRKVVVFEGLSRQKYGISTPLHRGYDVAAKAFLVVKNKAEILEEEASIKAISEITETSLEDTCKEVEGFSSTRTFLEIVRSRRSEVVQRDTQVELETSNTGTQTIRKIVSMMIGPAIGFVIGVVFARVTGLV